MTNFFDPQLEKKPDFVECMKRIYAWNDHQVIDRVPIRFASHNAEYNIVDATDRWPDLKSQWYDVEYQVDKGLKTVENSSYLGETFPLYWPNLGPNVFAAMFGSSLEFGDVTSWASACIEDSDELEDFHFDPDNEFLRKLNEFTDCALEKCKNKCLVGYTDMHPGLDFADAILGTENLLCSCLMEPELVSAIIGRCTGPFFEVMDAFHKKLFDHHQLSCTWMQIPSYEGVHIPSCDLSSMVSDQVFRDLALPAIKQETTHFRHNIFHVDGKGVARHIDDILNLPEIQACQWVQGMGLDTPIMQWVPFIQHIQDAGKSVVVDLKLAELDVFMEAVRPEGILLCMDEADAEIQQRVLNKLLTWK